MHRTATAIAATLAFCAAEPVLAGGAWIPRPGTGYVFMGFTRKTANSSWDASGDAFVHMRGDEEHWHDFRYVYLTAEVGILDRVSLVLTGTWLYGLEGPRSDYEKNAGLSEAYLGLKYQVVRGRWPMAIALNHRNPAFYDLPGPYDRHLFDENGQQTGVSPEWRGLLKRDYSVSWVASTSFAGDRAWAVLEGGYRFREGAPADQVVAYGELGYPLPFFSSLIKGSGLLEVSVGSDSPATPDDRFRARDGYNFNDASYGRLGASWIVPLGAARRWTLEVGYNQWVWGRSARRYHEPFVTIGRSF